MLKHVVSVTTALALAVFISLQSPASTNDLKNGAGLTVHEWGTFTSVAGEDGRAVEWFPYGGPTGRSDLPCFVERFDQFPEWRLSATVRMETPVLYFYSARSTTVDVRVRFPEGIMTEWYPHATVKETVPNEESFRGYFNGIAGLEWRGVKVLPATNPALPAEAAASHYYAARQTGAAPVRVENQDEKFLFYRGVGTFAVPLAASVQQNGRITIRKLGKNEIPSVILFENRGGRMGFRASGALKNEITLDPPNLQNDFAALERSLESVLIQNGLYPKEAQAMLATWRDLWFEEGVRVFYIVPRRDVDKILPLEIQPKPAQVERVFVGRMEIITPADEARIGAAIRANDQPTLRAYANFLNSVTTRLLAKSATAGDRARLKEFQDRSLNSPAYWDNGSRCEAQEPKTDLALQ